ncbi:glycosyl hydrolase family 8 [Celerinatantimonas sp. MCCC 1A17872]|uniref:glycosyl hydrolase family 8 n=1 Tax=Celerinatantimonas sp. MCCC 1A17872 TaxID=3177514 RepID=UPI0038C13AA0
MANKKANCFKILATLLLLFSFSVEADITLDWPTYKARFMMDDGRIIDTGNHSISHTEGQGVGMLFAVAANDPESFKKIWHWTQTTLEDKKSHLFYWRYDPTAPMPVKDHNNASDGDTLIAWALLKAGQKWHNLNYLQSSDQITQALIRYTVVDFAHHKVMLPGRTSFQFKNKIDINPSYFIFPAWQDFAKRSHLQIWNELTKDAFNLLKTMRGKMVNLPGDWLTLHDDGVFTPASRWPARMSYDAIRIPLYLYWQQPNSDLLGVWKHWFKKYSRLQTPAWVNVQSAKTANYPMQGGLLAVRDLSLNQLNRSDTHITHQDDYYSASLKMLTVLAYKHF